MNKKIISLKQPFIDKLNGYGLNSDERIDLIFSLYKNRGIYLDPIVDFGLNNQIPFSTLVFRAMERGEFDWINHAIQNVIQSHLNDFNKEDNELVAAFNRLSTPLNNWPFCSQPNENDKKNEQRDIEFNAFVKNTLAQTIVDLLIQPNFNVFSKPQMAIVGLMLDFLINKDCLSQIWDLIGNKSCQYAIREEAITSLPEYLIQKNANREFFNSFYKRHAELIMNREGDELEIIPLSRELIRLAITYKNEYAIVCANAAISITSSDTSIFSQNCRLAPTLRLLNLLRNEGAVIPMFDSLKELALAKVERVINAEARLSEKEQARLFPVLEYLLILDEPLFSDASLKPRGLLRKLLPSIDLRVDANCPLLTQKLMENIPEDKLFSHFTSLNSSDDRVERIRIIDWMLSGGKKDFILKNLDKFLFNKHEQGVILQYLLKNAEPFDSVLSFINHNSVDTDDLLNELACSSYDDNEVVRQIRLQAGPPSSRYVSDEDVIEHISVFLAAGQYGPIEKLTHYGERVIQALAEDENYTNIVWLASQLLENKNPSYEGKVEKYKTQIINRISNILNNIDGVPNSDNTLRALILSYYQSPSWIENSLHSLFREN